MFNPARRKYVATLCERFATVALAAGLASEFFAEMTVLTKGVVITSFVLVIVLGWLAATE